MRALPALALPALAALAMLAGPQPARPAAGPPFELVARTPGHRPVRAFSVHRERAPVRVLVVGCIHGDETAGIPVIHRLQRSTRIPGVDIWVIPNLNPDGRALHRRTNGRGVDLNRNFASRWRARGRRGDPEYPGPRPFSEPESRFARRVIRELRPAVTIWFHQPETVVRAWGPSRSLARRYARAAGMRYRPIPWPAGTAPRWQNQRLHEASFVVELPPGPISSAAVERQAHAVRVLVAAVRARGG
jgi:protein MpaA